MLKNSGLDHTVLAYNGASAHIGIIIMTGIAGIIGADTAAITGITVITMRMTNKA